MEIVFYVVGGVAAAWAVLLTAVGVTRPSFPAGRAATTGVMLISALLVAGAVGTGIVAAAEEEEGAEEAETAEAEEAEAEEAEEPVEEEAAEPAGGGQGAGEELELTADPSGELAFDRTELEADAGPVTIVLDNPAPLPHDVSLEGNGVDERGETVGEGGTSTVSADLSPGEYTFYCSVPGHREGGMEGTLTVR